VVVARLLVRVHPVIVRATAAATMVVLRVSFLVMIYFTLILVLVITGDAALAVTAFCLLVDGFERFY